MFIVFEGLESSGKSTQITKFIEYLAAKGHPVEAVAEPGSTELGLGVRQLVLHRNMAVNPMAELLLYEAARAQLTQERIRPALAAGKVVVCDRYTLSSIAYQGHGRGLDLDRLRALDAWATDGLKPDLTLFFDITLEEMRRRLGHGDRPDRVEREDEAFFERVRGGYLQALEGLAGAHRFDGTLPAEVLFAVVVKRVEPLLDDGQGLC